MPSELDREQLYYRQKSRVLSDKEVLTVNRGSEHHEVSEIVDRCEGYSYAVYGWTIVYTI
jgi:hypothetical protein